VVGAVIGALVAVNLPTSFLARLFGAFLLFSAYRIAVGARRQPATPPVDSKPSS
jgi:uncharacterized membrane protein YfcA